MTGGGKGGSGVLVGLGGICAPHTIVHALPAWLHLALTRPCMHACWMILMNAWAPPIGLCPVHDSRLKVRAGQGRKAHVPLAWALIRPPLAPLFPPATHWAGAVSVCCVLCAVCCVLCAVTLAWALICRFFGLVLSRPGLVHLLPLPCIGKEWLYYSAYRDLSRPPPAVYTLWDLRA